MNTELRRYDDDDDRTRLDSIDKTLHKTNEWLGGVMDNM